MKKYRKTLEPDEVRQLLDSVARRNWQMLLHYGVDSLFCHPLRLRESIEQMKKATARYRED